MASIIARGSRARRTPIRKRPSEASMFSVVTHNSNSSNGSNTTVTPESVAKAKHRSSKPVAPRKTADARPSNKKSSRSAPTMPSVEERPNVFEFMVEDEEGGVGRGDAVELDGTHATQPLRVRTASVSSSSSAEQKYCVRPKATQDDQYHRWNERSFPSGSSFTDSGISVRSSSPERDFPIMRHKLLNNRPLDGKSREVEDDQLYNTIDRYAASPRVLGPFDGGPETSPEAFYSMSSRPSFQDHEFDSSIGHLPPQRSNMSADETHDEDPATSEDYANFACGRLASHISVNRTTALKPIYRKFESLNNRALLSLQGEVASLEIQLKHVDEALANTSKVGASGETSANVHTENVRSLQWQRTELMRSILRSLEHYNRALSSYSGLSKHLDIVSEQDINAYQEWISENASLAATQDTFLIHREDLVTIASSYNREGPGSERSAVATGFAVLMTIIAFRITPQFLSRLVVGTVIGLAMSCSGMPSISMDLNCLREYGKRALVYASVLVVLALAVR
ncbi:hypothetical protein MMC11_003438 [Xylographa trunciseda]|nr:hypothetical protein [Xylographa trunciseda]